MEIVDLSLDLSPMMQYLWRMAKKPIQPEIVDLSQWLTAEEAIALRAEIKRPLSEQRLYALADSGKIATRKIKGRLCWSREGLIQYRGQRGFPKGKKRRVNKEELAA
jgi:hypothetical protein